MQLSEKQKYEFKEPVQPPIAPPYSFLKHSLTAKDIDEDIKKIDEFVASCSSSKQETVQDTIVADSDIENLDNDFTRINITNAGTSVSKIISQDLSEGKEYVDIEKVLKELKEDPTYDIPADYELPYQDKPFIPIPASPELFKDFIQKVTDMRTKYSDSKFSPPVLLSDLAEAEKATSGDGSEQYESYIQDVKPHFSKQSDEPALKSTYLVSNNLEDNEDEHEFIKVIKEAFVSDKPVDKDIFLSRLNEAIKQVNCRNFDKSCTCYGDSDSDN